MARAYAGPSTPKRVRGKRAGARKCSKRRQPDLRYRPGALPSSLSTTTSSGKNVTSFRKATIELSPLESLPAELLQYIFELSANVDLPVASQTLKTQLSRSRHLQSQLSTESLAPVLGCRGKTATAQVISRAVRVLNSRFMTWQFFCDWLVDYSRSVPDVEASTDIHQLWQSLSPSLQLWPPRKVLVGPYPADKVSLLSVLSQNVHDIIASHALAAEWAYEGLVAAVRENCVEAARLLIGLGLRVDTELLQAAVIDAGCHRTMVMLLLNGGLASEEDGEHAQTAQKRSRFADSFDPLDPMLWSWAERARSRKDPTGDWLLRRLRSIRDMKSKTWQ